MYRIIQISDLHIPSHETGKFDIKIKKQFSLLIDKLTHECADLLVISGDLAYSHGTEGIYSYIHSKLKLLKIPFLIIPGNHDSPMLLRKFFAIKSEDEEQIFFTYKTEYDELIFLDSSDNQISEKQILWLKSKLNASSGRVIIFVHHPVIDTGVKYMDAKNAMKNNIEIENILVASQKNVLVFCGHFHSDTTVVKNNIIQYLCPSNYYQISPVPNFLEVENASTGYRIIELSDESIMSRIRFFTINNE